VDSDYLFGNAQYPSGSVPDGFDPGAYVALTLFTGMHNDMQTAREEIFGPVGAVLSFPSIDEAVKIANDSIFGLAAGIWSSDVTIAHKMPCDIDAGVIWVNCFDHANSSTKSRRRSGNYDMLRLPVLMHCFYPNGTRS
jgi:acyl-CoA reductase-like NAD-dependent aldehyde dehydrogenase